MSAKRDGPIAESPPKETKGEGRRSKFSRGLWLSAGLICLGAGLVGIILPVLPTTPFLLLAAACFAKSSKRMHEWMMHNRVFGGYLRAYYEGQGIPLRIRVATIVFLWAVIVTTVLLFANNLTIQVLLLAIAFAVSVHIASIRPRRKNTAGT